MPTDHRERLARIRRFDQLVAYLRDELGWPIESDDFEELTFEYTPEELGIDAKNAAKIQEIKRLRPLVPNQPWGIFFVKFEPKRLPVVALRRILSQVALKKRASANKSERQAWAADDLLFVSNYGEGDGRRIAFAHFSKPQDGQDLPTLKVLGWDNLDTPLHLDAVARELTAHLAWPDDVDDADTWRERWRAAFTLRHREVITTSQQLSERLAELARAIRDRIKTTLAIETEAGPLTRLMKAFQTALVHDLDEAGFADMYAQTIAYGLLSARITDPARRTADDFAAHMRTNPFLKELMETFLHVGGRRGKAGGPGIDFDELGVSEVVELLDRANMEAVVRDFGDRNPQEDPVIHFYEHFLAAYDKKQKVSRGVFYTPRPVVSYIVRSVDDLLRTEFGLEDGLADITTWSEMAERNKDLKVPDGTPRDQPFVQILDPATGTGTFLVEVIDLLHKTMVQKWKVQGQGEKKIQALWNEYVPKHLLPRLHGYELLMAPYAIAHLKIGLKLYETGYRFGSEERARVYLTNALEPAGRTQLELDFLPALAHEAQAVNEIKRSQRFTVLIGNPPYSVNSANKESPLDRELDEYKKDLHGERNLKPLNDDYIKFMRLAHLATMRAGRGLIGLVTNHSYTTARLFRGIRRSILRDFQRVQFLDLRGDMGRDPRMAADENVFEIQQGVGVTLLSLAGRSDSSVPIAYQYELIGTQKNKQLWLAEHSSKNTPWIEATPHAPLFGFKELERDIGAEYGGFFPVDRAFTVGNVGYQTHRDDFVIDCIAGNVVSRIAAFRDAREEEDGLSKRFAVRSNRDWSLLEARRALRRDSDWKDRIRLTLYRPFDLRYIAYAPYLIDYDRSELMRHMKENNQGLLVSKVFDEHEFTSVLASKWIVESKAADRTRGSHLFPLRIDASEVQPGLAHGARSGWISNLSKELTVLLMERLNVAIHVNDASGDASDVSDLAVFGYFYAALHSPIYRKRYVEFLKSDFPRVPLPGDRALFGALARLGCELSSLHLLESPKLDDPVAPYGGPKNPEIKRVGWSDGTVWLDAGKTNAREGHRATKPGTIGFKGVPEDAWDFHIGGYQVCHKWLKDRKGRTLSEEDIAHYQKIIVALSETIRIMAEIDEVIEAHGGWPGAFQTEEAATGESQLLLKVAEPTATYVGKSPKTRHK